MGERRYSIYDRPKLPRNKYGNLYDLYGVNSSSSSSLFGSSEGANLIGNTDMASLSEFVGATDSENGIKGLVPAPQAGEQDYFLQGTGKFEYIPAYKWLEEFPTGAGLEKSGLTINGDFNVAKTLSTMDLKVEGAAHFWTLIIDEVKANGGQVLISPSTFHVDYVDDIQYYPLFTEDSKLTTLITVRKDIDKMCRACNVTEVKCRRVWCRNDDGSKQTTNNVEIGDMLRCRSFNIKNGVYNNVSNTDYWTFVCRVGPDPNEINDPKTFIDEDGVERSGFWIDIAYALKLSNGHSLPLGTVLYEDGTVEIPDTYVEIENALDLKKISNETLTGSRNVEEEYFDSEEFLDIQNKVIKIRGLDSNLNYLIGEESSNSLTDNSLDFLQVTQQLEFIANGTLDNNADESDLASLIVSGTYSDDSSNLHTQSDIQSSQSISREIQSRNIAVEDAEYGLKLDKIQKNDIILANGTVVEREGGFIAADDLYDMNGDKVYDKGDLIPENTVVDGNWKVVDHEGEDEVFAVDEGTEFIPSDEEEINNGTKNTETGMDRNVNKFIDKDYLSATEWRFGYGTFSIKSGDNLSCLGHLYDTDRANAIVLSSNDPIDNDLKAPCMAQYSSIDTFGESISNYRLTAIASNGNEFIGSFFVNYNGSYLDINERINLFVTDIKTGLEKVGIHLDGDNSTITLVGSVDLRQHSNTSYDTLNVYDNIDVKRVEILPFDIPKRESPESSIDITNKYFNLISTSKNATKSYINYDRWKHWWFWPFNYDWVYKYELHDYIVSLTSSTNIGYLSVGSKLDLSNLDIHIWADTYLAGKTFISNHGTGEQEITTFTYTIKKDGVVVYGPISIKDISGLIITGIDTNDIKLMLGRTFLDDYTIQSSGTYSIDIKVIYSVYAYTTSWDYYSNYYYRVDCGLSGSVRTSISKSSSTGNDSSNRKMTIGTNGFVFNCNNSRYFYAGNDGYEFKWDDASIRLDSEYGLRETKLYETITSGKMLNKKYDIVIANYASNGYTCYLPSCVDYGVGRKLTVIAFQGLKLVTSGVDKVRVNTANSFIESESIEFGTGSGTSIVMPKYVVELIAINGVWYIVSYF